MGVIQNTVRGALYRMYSLGSATSSTEPLGALPYPQISKVRLAGGKAPRNVKTWGTCITCEPLIGRALHEPPHVVRTRWVSYSLLCEAPTR